jgi:lipopolysaccharide export system protein LptA
VFFSYYERSLSFRDDGDSEKRLLPENVSAATEGFSFLQSEQGRAKFEINAKVNLGFKDNKNLLESVTVKVFGKDGSRHDTISSDRCEYDQQSEEIVFAGNVVILLSAGASKASDGKVDSVLNDKVTTIQVEKITYLKATGTAQTEELVRFSKENIRGTSRGLTYNATQESVRLHSAVEIFVEPEGPEESQIELRCDRLDYDRKSELIEMHSNVSLLKGDTSMEADLLRAWLRKGDSSISRVDAVGRVHSVSKDPRALSQVDAHEVSYLFDATGRWVERVIAQQEVRSRSLNPLVKRDLSAQEMTIDLRPNSNIVRSINTKGNVVLNMGEKKDDGASRDSSGLSQPLADPRFDRDSAPGDRRVRAPEIQLMFREDGHQLSLVQAKGGSTVEEFPRKPKDDKVVLTARSVDLSFMENSKIEKLLADQNVQVDIIPLSSAIRRTTSDHLQALVDPVSQQISELHQSGNFRYREADQQASADVARYFVGNKLMVLEGKPSVRDLQSRTTASIIEFDQQRNLVKARGNVRSFFDNSGNASQLGIYPGNAPVYASAEFLDIQRDKGVATYRQQAKLWQEDQVLRADTIVINWNDKRLAADKNVVSLFYVEEESPGNSAEKTRKPVTVRAEKLVYEDEAHKATYSNAVRMASDVRTIQSNELEVFFTDDGNKKSVERMVATGRVKIAQPGKLATSESAEFFQSERKAILTGGMPRVVDSERGSTSGARLTLFFDDGSISVVGSPETRSITRQRVTR